MENSNYGIKVLKNVKRIDFYEFHDIKNRKNITVVSYTWRASGKGSTAGSALKLVYEYDLLIAFYFYGISATNRRYSPPYFKGEIEHYQNQMCQCSWNLKRFKNHWYGGKAESVNPSEY